ncbi:MAG: class I SAM-dependent methyltransferase [Candidatus Kapabacteria bacterium]|nr:class I SAM-dependent methyltransferase [Candidatus Kapabacteria bacterium]
MSPRRLYDKDFNKVLKALIEFYNERPDSYGLMERPIEVYDKYKNFIIEQVQDKNSKILDLGTGSWRAVNKIAEYGYEEVVGLDYFSDEKLYEYSSKITYSNAKLNTYNENGKIPYPDNYFDCVTSLCVIEHIVYVKDALDELVRVLKPGGKAIIICPNWSGINVPIMAFLYTLKSKDRRWQLHNPIESLFGIIRSIKWYFEALLSNGDDFIMIYPLMKNDRINFERSDDDAIHLCQPLSFKKYFSKRGFKKVKFNRGSGETQYSKLFNNLFPNMSTTNEMVFEKSK